MEMLDGNGFIQLKLEVMCVEFVCGRISTTEQQPSLIVADCDNGMLKLF